MKHLFTTLAIPLLLLICIPFGAYSQTKFQDDSIKFVKKELNSYYNELQSLNEKIIDYDTYERFASDYRNCEEKISIFNERYKYFIADNNKLSPIWSDIRDLQEDIDEKILDMKREHEQKIIINKLYQELENTKVQYEQLLARLQILNELKRNAAHDTLASIKNRDKDIFAEYTTCKTQHKELIIQNQTLSAFCDDIENSHKRICDTKDIETIKWGDRIFKITIIAAVLFFLINLIVSKKNLKDQLKKNKQTPTI